MLEVEGVTFWPVAGCSVDADNINLRTEASTGGTWLKYTFATTCDDSRTFPSPRFLGLAAFPALAGSMLDISVDSSPSRVGKSFSTVRVRVSSSPPPSLSPLFLLPSCLYLPPPFPHGGGLGCPNACSSQGAPWPGPEGGKTH